MGVKVEKSSDESQDENVDESQMTFEDLLAEMQRMHRALPVRPTFEQVEAARAAIASADSLLVSRLEELFLQPKPEAVPASVFRAFQEMREAATRAQIEEQKRPWQAVLDLEDRHRHYDSLLQRVQTLLGTPSRPFGFIAKDSKTIESHGDEIRRLLSASFSSNDEVEDVDRHLSNDKSPPLETVHGHKDFNNNGSIIVPLQNQSSIYQSNNPEANISSPEIVIEKPSSLHRSTVSLPKQTELRAGVTPAITYLSSTPTASTNLSGSLSLSTNGLSHSRSSSSSAFEPLSTIHEDVAGNRFPPKLIAILEKAVQSQPEILDLSGNHFEELIAFPESIGLLTSLSTLNLSGTQIQILPESIGALTNLVRLELEANQLRSLPESLGCLSCLKVLNIEKNMIEELPWTIGHCTALEELKADFNQLKALPEALGRLSHLRYLSVHLNSLKSLPSTVGNLKALEELDVHFNQLEYVPESLCSLTSLRKLDLSSNFTDLRALPESIGNLQGLQHLNISYNHITVLPDTFVNLTYLLKLELDGNPFRDPPLHVIHKGKEAILDYMKEKVTRKERDRTLKLKKGVFHKLAIKFTGLVKRQFGKKTVVSGWNTLA